MIKGVLFDYGGVVAAGGRGIEIAQKLSKALELPETATNEILMPIFKDFTRGKLDENAFWHAVEVQAAIQVSDSQRHLWDDWWGVQPYPKMREAIDNLKAAGYPVGLLSNIIPPAKAKIEAGGGYSHFDFVILSCDVGFAKPDPEMYNLALAKFDDLKPEEVVFIDDQQKCLPPAEALGIKTILAENTDQILGDMRSLDLPV